VDGQVAELAKAGVNVSDFNKGNIKARQRMITQYAVAGENSGAVIGTDHAAENLTGFFTKFGDGGADILPLFRLFENEWRVWEIANLLRRVELCQLPYFQLLSSCSLTFIN